MKKLLFILFLVSLNCFAFNKSYYTLFKKEAKATMIDPKILGAICFVESSWRLKALNKFDGNSPSYGICQIKLTTAKMMGFSGTYKELILPKNNIHYSALYYKEQLIKYNGDEMCAIAAYNAGTCRLNSNNLIKNRKYVKKVLHVVETLLDKMDQ